MATNIEIRRYSSGVWGTVYPKANWNNMDNKPSTFTPSSHTHSQYLEKTGANGLSEGTSDITDNTEILTSYASNNGFADTNAAGVIYRRDAVKMYNYIKGKLDSVYQPKGTYLTSHQDISGKLDKSGGTMTGDLVIGDATNELYFRTSSGWQSGMYYHRTGSEAMVFCNNQFLTSWIFESGISPGSRLDWSTFDGASGHPSVPSMQIKNQKVVINKFIAQNTEAAYNLDVGGTANATTIYENGTAIDTIMDNKIQAAIGDAIAASY